MVLRELDYTLANGKVATDTKPSTNSNTVADLNNPSPIDFNNKDWQQYPKAKKFNGQDSQPMISKLKCGAVLISDNGTIQAYITDNDTDKTQHVYVYNKKITNKEESRETTQNILDKLTNASVDSFINTISQTSSGFKEVFSESLFIDNDFVI